MSLAFVKNMKYCMLGGLNISKLCSLNLKKHLSHCLLLQELISQLQIKCIFLKYKYILYILHIIRKQVICILFDWITLSFKSFNWHSCIHFWYVTYFNICIQSTMTKACLLTYAWFHFFIFSWNFVLIICFISLRL